MTKSLKCLQREFPPPITNIIWPVGLPVSAADNVVHPPGRGLECSDTLRQTLLAGSPVVVYGRLVDCLPVSLMPITNIVSLLPVQFPISVSPLFAQLALTKTEK